MIRAVKWCPGPWPRGNIQVHLIIHPTSQHLGEAAGLGARTPGIVPGADEAMQLSPQRVGGQTQQTSRGGCEVTTTRSSLLLPLLLRLLIRMETGHEEKPPVCISLAWHTNKCICQSQRTQQHYRLTERLPRPLRCADKTQVHYITGKFAPKAKIRSNRIKKNDIHKQTSVDVILNIQHKRCYSLSLTCFFALPAASFMAV